MAVTTQNLFFNIGDSYTFNCLAQDYQQTVINLTGATLACVATRTPPSDTLFSGTCTVVSNPLGTFTVNFTSASTTDLPNFPQEVFYTVTVTKSGQTYTVQSGSIYLSPK